MTTTSKSLVEFHLRHIQSLQCGVRKGFDFIRRSIAPEDRLDVINLNSPFRHHNQGGQVYDSEVAAATLRWWGCFSGA